MCLREREREIKRERERERERGEYGRSSTRNSRWQSGGKVHLNPPSGFLPFSSWQGVSISLIHLTKNNQLHFCFRYRFHISILSNEKRLETFSRINHWAISKDVINQDLSADFFPPMRLHKKCKNLFFIFNLTKKKKIVWAQPTFVNWMKQLELYYSTP